MMYNDLSVSLPPELYQETLSFMGLLDQALIDVEQNQGIDRQYWLRQLQYNNLSAYHQYTGPTLSSHNDGLDKKGADGEANLLAYLTKLNTIPTSTVIIALMLTRSDQLEPYIDSDEVWLLYAMISLTDPPLRGARKYGHCPYSDPSTLFLRLAIHKRITYANRQYAFEPTMSAMYLFQRGAIADIDMLMRFLHTFRWTQAYKSLLTVLALHPAMYNQSTTLLNAYWIGTDTPMYRELMAHDTILARQLIDAPGLNLELWYNHGGRDTYLADAIELYTRPRLIKLSSEAMTALTDIIQIIITRHPNITEYVDVPNILRRN